MKYYARTIKPYVSDHKQQFLMALGIIAIIIIVPLVAWAIRSQKPSYEPAKACDMLTVTRAENLLGERVNNIEANKPVTANNIATSKCGYTDVDRSNMHVAALVVKSAVNDKGISELHKAFKKQLSVQGNEPVKHLANSAYFNTEHGLLYVLDHKNVLIISYGAGANPSANDLTQLVDLAHTLLKKPTPAKN